MSYAEEIFEQAWNNPEYTQARLDDVDINKTLSRYYDTSIPLTFTRTMLWDNETKKAWDPNVYIPYAVKDAHSWGKETLENGDEVFVRASQQKQWLNPKIFKEVFEEVYVNHRDQKVTFLGVQNVNDRYGNHLQTDNEQPLFHVQHSVEGDENNPINVWRIVHLTEGKDQQLIDLFNKMSNPTVLPGYVETYIERDLQISISHK